MFGALGFAPRLCQCFVAASANMKLLLPCHGKRAYGLLIVTWRWSVVKLGHAKNYGPKLSTCLKKNHFSPPPFLVKIIVKVAGEMYYDDICNILSLLGRAPHPQTSSQSCWIASQSCWIVVDSGVCYVSPSQLVPWEYRVLSWRRGQDSWVIEWSLPDFNEAKDNPWLASDWPKKPQWTYVTY